MTNNETVIKVLSLLLNPGIFLVIASLVSIYFKVLRQKFSFAIFISAALILLVAQYNGLLMFHEFNLLGLKLTPLQITDNNFLLAASFLLCLFCQILFFNDIKNLRLINSISGAICGLGIVAISSSDYLTLIISNELIVILSTLLIFMESSDKSYNIGFRYISIHIFSSVLLLMGIAILVNTTGSLSISPIKLSECLSSVSSGNIQNLGQYLIVLALLVDCATFPFSNWLVNSYSSTHPYVSITISSYGTKVILFFLAKIFLGNDLLLYIGLISMLYSGVLSLATGNIRQIISYNMVNKFGFILVCIGFGGASVEKIVIYLIAYYVMSNLILFLVAGKLNISSGVSAINELLIYDRKSMLFIAVGVISTIAFPLTGGYLAKLDLFQVLTSDKLLYALVTILAIPPMAALLKLLLPYIRKEDLIRSDKDEWIKTETASLTISTIFILFSAIFYNYFVTDDSATNDHNAIGHTISYLLSLFTIFGFLYFMRKSLIRHNLEVLDFDWFVRKPLTFFICKVIEILSLCQKKILLYIQSYDSYSIPSYTKHIIYSNWLIGTVISSFIVSLLTLFLLLYL